MKTQAMKRSVLALATALFAVSTCAFAQVTKAPVLTDAQLDQVTAGGAMSAVILFNSGKADVMHVNRNASHATCINCSDVGVPTVTGTATTGMVLVQPPRKTDAAMHNIRKNPFGM